MDLCILMDTNDNVATVLQETSPELELVIQDRSMTEVGKVTANESIPYAHKISVTNINKGDCIYKFGSVIGRAISDINKGNYVHVHNVISIKSAESIMNRGADK